MKKTSLLLSAVVLAGVAFAPSVAFAENTYTYTVTDANNKETTTTDATTTDPTNSTFANNQGTTSVTYVGDLTTDTTTKDSSKDSDGTVTTNNNGKQVKGLSLTAVPSFAFGTTNWIQSVYAIGTTGQTTRPVGDTSWSLDSTGKSVSTKSTGETTNQLYVRDNRGGTSGYQVYASASSLYNADGKELPVSGLTLSVANGAANALGGFITGTTNASVFQNTSSTSGGTAQSTADLISGGTKAADYYGRIAGFGNLIATGDKYTVGDNATGKVTALLKLANTSVVASKYTGVITYTLQDTSLNTSATSTALDLTTGSKDGSGDITTVDALQ
jgi:hypothetical protein